MYTAQDIEEIVHAYLSVPEVTQNVTGSVLYQDERGLSGNEDIAVKGLTITDASGPNNTQIGTVNVNIYVPDVKKNAGSAYVDLPNRERIKYITKMVIEALGGNKGKFWKVGNLWATPMSGAMRVEGKKEHFVNIRVQVKIHLGINEDPEPPAILEETQLADFEGNLITDHKDNTIIVLTES